MVECPWSGGEQWQSGRRPELLAQPAAAVAVVTRAHAEREGRGGEGRGGEGRGGEGRGGRKEEGMTLYSRGEEFAIKSKQLY